MTYLRDGAILSIQDFPPHYGLYLCGRHIYLEHRIGYFILPIKASLQETTVFCEDKNNGSHFFESVNVIEVLSNFCLFVKVIQDLPWGCG